MDNICHTLVGAALAEAGLKRRTALGTATLLVGANLPDIDVLSYVRGDTFALSFRRGVTHGLVALVILPLVLTGAMLAWDRWVRRRRTPDAVPATATAVLLLSFVSIATHPTLDFLNTYGMRWFMPFSGRWVYGDTLFIIDPWVWATLLAGVLIARGWRVSRWGSPARPVPRPAAAGIALGVLTAYIVVMAGLGIAGRVAVTRSLVADGLGAPERLMVAPAPVTPLRRHVVAEIDGGYVMGTLRYVPPSFELDQVRLSRFVVDADRGRVPVDARRFLAWARFPYAFMDDTDGRSIIELGDARYTLDPASSWAGVVVEEW